MAGVGCGATAFALSAAPLAGGDAGLTGSGVALGVVTVPFTWGAAPPTGLVPGLAVAGVPDPVAAAALGVNSGTGLPIF